MPLIKDPDFLATVLEYRDRGIAWHRAIRRLRCSKSTYYRALAEIRKGEEARADRRTTACPA